MPALTSKLILHAYRRGLFPMGDPRTGAIDWHAPDPRAILPLDAFHVPRSLARVCRSQRFELASDRDFEAVIDACARPTSTWITSEIRDAYVALHRDGHAHTIEAYAGGELAGGLYGVCVGGAFMGESMFHRRTDAGKVCLVALVGLLRRQGFALLDTQFITPHLRMFGAIEIPRAEYLDRLAAALRLSPAWAPATLSG
ncbi:MAG: leucyl/phenylalanyl-tRNA--protein transferase [Planctomycetes bacterium]|nr:leucyl/phenylalanyl-tRNA--protein transferase [Planctomycetota bacterium]